MQHETPTPHEDGHKNAHHEEPHHVPHSAHTAHHEHHRPKTILSTPIAILLGAAILAIGLLGHGYLSQKGGNLDYLESFTGKAPTTDAYVEGKKNADVYFVEYSDTECPYCTAFHKTVSEMRQKYAGKITFIYRHYPLPFHPDAMPEAIQLNCVGKLKGEKAYYDFMTKLFDFKVGKQESKQALKITPEFIAAFLSANGINSTEFNKCVADPTMKAEVEASIQDGSQAGVSGTPTSFILVKNGDDFKVVKKLEGASQSAFIIPLIEKALKM